MKILILNDSCKEVGGAETYIFAISKLLGKNHDVFLYSFGDEEEDKEKRRIIKHSKGIVRYFNKFIFNFEVYRELRKYIQKIKPDVVFMHNNYIYSNSVLQALEKEKVNVVQTVHDWGLMCPSSWHVIKKGYKKCSGCEGSALKCMFNGCVKIDHYFMTCFRNKWRIKTSKKIIKQFISPSEELASDLRKRGFKNVKCVHNFMEMDPEKPRFDNSEKGLITYIGLLGENKGLDYLVRAFKIVKKEYPLAKLKIIGGGPDEKRLKSIAKEISVEVDFPGKIPHKEVFDAFSKCKVFVLPSVWMENSPFTIYEAMSMGRPVVGSGRGGITDLVLDGKTGFLAEPANSKDLARKILRILKDDTLFKKLGKNAYEYVTKDLNYRDHVKRVEKVLLDNT
jgi:glycosyltransferase involved in cell wall biosynthesis